MDRKNREETVEALLEFPNVIVYHTHYFINLDAVLSSKGDTHMCQTSVE